MELTEAAIDRITNLDTAINAVVVRDFDRARVAAREADAALARGERRPLLGLPMTVKESHNAVGMPATWGIQQFAGWASRSDSLAITRLKEAGAVILGKTNIAVGLADWQSNNPIYGRTLNPHDPARSPGGSSGGAAAALAAGIVALEVGSDLAGSVRVPAHFCGVFGHKPSWGLVPNRDHVPPGAAVGGSIPFAVLGPMAQTATDLVLALKVLAGPAPIDGKAWRLDLPVPRAKRLCDFRVLVLDRHPLAKAGRDVTGVLNRLADRLADAGAKVERCNERLLDLEAAHAHYSAMQAVIARRDSPPMTAAGWIEGQNFQETHRLAWEALFEHFDVLLAPPFGTAAFLHDDTPVGERTLMIDDTEVPYLSQRAWSEIATFPGLPSTCAPAGRNIDGLPVGVQIIGPSWGDLTTLHLAELMARELGMTRLAPVLRFGLER